MVGEFSDGKLVAVKGTNIDITEKKNREQEIRSQNEKLNAILNSLPDKLFIHDAAGNYLEAYTTDNSGFIVPMEKFIGKNLRDVFPADVAGLNLKNLHESRRNNKIVIHEYSNDYNGSILHFEVRVVPFMDDKVIRFVRDITERKEIEMQISKLNKAIEQSPVAIIITDTDANITYASSAIEEMTGYQKHELLGKNIGILKSEKNREGLYNEIWEAIKSGLNWDGELINKKKNGKSYWANMSITPLYESGNQITGYLAVKQDITEKKRNEQEILELNSSLERKVEDRTNQLKKANEELVKARDAAEEANKAKSLFLANMSHEIRTPLNSIIGFSELLFNSSIDEKKRSQVASIRNSGRSLLNIINDILDLSKVEAGKIIIEAEPLNVLKVVSEVGNIFSQKATEKKLDLILEQETALTTPLMLDETRLRQILFNLVGNAIKFTQKGSVSVFIHHEEKDNNLVDLRIRVTDTGIGIPGDQLSAIFDPFVQQKGQLNKTYGGTGLGLAISRRMAEAMGGEISVKSVTGKGSEFTIYLKNVAKAVTQREEKENNPLYYSTIRFDKKTILIVDDIYDNRIMLLDTLEDTGARLLEAENGAEAVQLAKTKKPDIILMDIRMPVMDGLEACRIIKNTPETAGIPCIAVSASINLGKPGKDIPENFDDNLMKPVAFDQLFDMLSRFLKPTEETGISEDSPETVFKDEKKWTDDLKRFAENELVPLYNHVMRTQLVDEMEDFGKQLISAGNRFDDELLLNTGKRISDFADQFEVDKLTLIMREFQLLLNRKLK
jgi:PAS domain S-box-containing protein